MYICIHIIICAYIPSNTYIFTDICINRYLFIFKYVYTYIYMYMYILYTEMYFNTCVYIYMYMHIHFKSQECVQVLFGFKFIYTHTHIHIYAAKLHYKKITERHFSCLFEIFRLHTSYGRHFPD